MEFPRLPPPTGSRTAPSSLYIYIYMHIRHISFPVFPPPTGSRTAPSSLTQNTSCSGNIQYAQQAIETNLRVMSEMVCNNERKETCVWDLPHIIGTS